MKNMTNDLKWRLKELPTAEGIAALVEQEIITAEEAREILLSDTKQTDDVQDLKEQLEFFKELVKTLSKKPSGNIYYPQWVETRPWWGPTWTYVNAVTPQNTSFISTTSGSYVSSDANQMTLSAISGSSSNIE